jgi:hypothetical protein
MITSDKRRLQKPDLVECVDEIILFSTFAVASN